MKIIAPLLLAGACADPPEESADPEVGADEGGVSHVEQEGGVTQTRVDASSEEAWVYLDLDGRRALEVADPLQDGDWDLAFQRFKVKTNSGVNGEARVLTAMVEGPQFEGLTRAPDAGYVVDAPDGDDEDTEPDWAFLAHGGWYAYDAVAHTLSPRERVYVVQSSEKNYFKVEMLGYYDDAGTSGVVSFRWAEVEAPLGGEPEPEVDHEPGPLNNANNPQNNDNSGPLPSDPGPAPEGALFVEPGDGAWVRVDLERAAVVAQGDESWDLAFQAEQLQTHGGTSGPGLAGVRVADEGGDFDAVTSASALGYEVDEMVPVPGPPGSGLYSGNPLLNEWYLYDPATHAVASRRTVYALRSAEGGYFKVQIHAFREGKYELLIEPLPLALEVVTLSVSAPSDGWAYVSLRDGGEVFPANDGEGSWDVAFQRTKVQTNSGTSGEGMGGALVTEASGLEALLEVPEGEFVEDEMVPVPGPPGSGEFSGNPLLNAWYDYDPSSHAMTPKPLVYVIRTADGHYAKLAFLSYGSGTVEVAWMYAGAGRASFAP